MTSDTKYLIIPLYAVLMMSVSLVSMRRMRCVWLADLLSGVQHVAMFSNFPFNSKGAFITGCRRLFYPRHRRPSMTSRSPSRANRSCHTPLSSIKVVF